ncbi:MAG: type 4a pilus biogenesis protein PilO [Magnetococcales bacterium]|nr:type 4a pilus biogenesis protein PilO [Magnetococcales bacterium]MBF0114652.1 type 4a pilus biogenesis protein PilO [Magnetococcales bacterium]
MELGFDPLLILRLSRWQRLAVVLAILALPLAAYAALLAPERLESLQQVQNSLQQQEEQMASKRRLLARLPQMREELNKLKAEEERLAQRLPSEKEIPTLLTDISTLGLEQGLEFILFAPGSELVRELHAEVPVTLEVRGSFPALAQFIDRLARMPRIVTLSDWHLEPNKEQPELLGSKARLTTYRFLTQKALEQKERDAKGKNKK